jgi:hypothetical protein
MSYSLEDYKNQFESAVKEYHEMMKGENMASVLMKWIIENNISTIFMPRQWDESVFTLEELMKLYSHLHWCLYDDGSVIFMDTSKGPIIYFDCEYNYSEGLPEELPHPLYGDKTIKVNGYVEDSGEFPWSFMKAWEERHDYLIKHRSKFKEWIPWETYKENYKGEY